MDRDVDAIYVAIMACAVLAGLLARRLSREPIAKTDEGEAKLGPFERASVAAGAIFGGTFGAKLPFVLADPEGAVGGWAWLADGRTITWGLAGGYLGVELAKQAAGVRAKTGDGFAMPVAVSIAVGRLGCLYAGCCYGAPTTMPWGMDLGDGVPRHPAQFVEVAFHLAMAVLLVWIARRGWLRLQRMKLYVLAYMVFRFASETLRPEPPFALGLTFYQWSAAGFALVFALLFVLDARARPAAVVSRPS